MDAAAIVERSALVAAQLSTRLRGFKAQPPCVAVLVAALDGVAAQAAELTASATRQAEHEPTLQQLIKTLYDGDKLVKDVASGTSNGSNLAHLGRTCRLTLSFARSGTTEHAVRALADALRGQTADMAADEGTMMRRLVDNLQHKLEQVVAELSEAGGDGGRGSSTAPLAGGERSGRVLAAIAAMERLLRGCAGDADKLLRLFPARPLPLWAPYAGGLHAAAAAMARVGGLPPGDPAWGASLAAAVAATRAALRTTPPAVGEMRAEVASATGAALPPWALPGAEPEAVAAAGSAVAPLPPGWEAYTDADGDVYFVNAATGESQWERPVAQPRPPPPAACPPPLPSGWEAYTDADGDAYFVNAATGESQWERPTAAAPAASTPTAAAAAEEERDERPPDDNDGGRGDYAGGAYDELPTTGATIAELLAALSAATAPGTEGAAARACQLLERAVRDPPNWDGLAPDDAALLERDATPAVAGALAAHPVDRDVAVWGCLLLAALAGSLPALQDAVCITGGGPSIVSRTIQTPAHAPRADVAGAGCYALHSMVEGGKVNLAAVAAGGGLAAARGALAARFPDTTDAHRCAAATVTGPLEDSVVVTFALKVLWRAACGDDPAATARREGLLADGVAQAVVAAMGSHHAHPDVAHYGCCLLMELAADGATLDISSVCGRCSGATRDTFIAAGVPAALVAAVHAYSWVRPDACWTLAALLTAGPEVRAAPTAVVDTIIDAGAVPAIVVVEGMAWDAYVEVCPGVAALWALVRGGNPVAQDAVLAAGGAAALAAALHNRSDSLPEICAPACAALEALSASGSPARAAAVAVASKGAAAVAHALQHGYVHQEERDPAVAEAAVRALRAMAVVGGPAIAGELAAAEAHMALYHALRLHPGDPATAVAACEALQALIAGSSSDGGEGAAPAALAPSLEPNRLCIAVVYALDAHPTDAAVSRAAMAAMRALVSTPEGATAEAMTAEGAAGIVQALRNHAADAAVARDAVGCLALLAGTDDTVICNVMVTAGAHTALAAALAAHPTDAPLAEAACRALEDIVHLHSDNLRDDVVEAGTQAAVVGALRAHVAHPGVAAAACSLLARLSRSFGNKGNVATAAAAVVAAGAVPAVLAAMAAHPGDPAVAAAGCHVVARLAHASPSTLTAVGEAGAPAAVVVALTAHTAHPDAARWGCLAVERLGYAGDANGHAISDAVVAAGAPAAVVAALAAHRANIDATRAALSALRALAANAPPATVEALVSAGAAAAVVGAMTALAHDNALVASDGVTTLMNMYLSKGPGAKAVSAAGGAAAARAAIEAHPDDTIMKIQGALITS